MAAVASNGRKQLKKSQTRRRKPANPDSIGSMEASYAPDFFLDESEPALRARAKWLNDELGLDTTFLAKVLHLSEASMERWKSKAERLPHGSKSVFREFWRFILHLLSHYDSERVRVRELFEQAAATVPAQEGSTAIPVELRHPLRVPWYGSTLKSYLESGGADAIDAVNRWIMSFRFGDPYSIPPKQ